MKDKEKEGEKSAAVICMYRGERVRGREGERDNIYLPAFFCVFSNTRGLTPLIHCLLSYSSLIHPSIHTLIPNDYL